MHRFEFAVLTSDCCVSRFQLLGHLRLSQNSGKDESMSAVIKEIVKIIHARQVFAHIGGPQQPLRLFAGRPVFCECPVQAFLRHRVIQHAAPGQSVEMINGKT